MFMKNVHENRSEIVPGDWLVSETKTVCCEHAGRDWNHVHYAASKSAVDFAHCSFGSTKGCTTEFISHSSDLMCFPGTITEHSCRRPSTPSLTSSARSKIRLACACTCQRTVYRPPISYLNPQFCVEQLFDPRNMLSAVRLSYCLLVGCGAQCFLALARFTRFLGCF